jgi:hypothetical protein
VAEPAAANVNHLPPDDRPRPGDHVMRKRGRYYECTLCGARMKVKDKDVSRIKIEVEGTERVVLLTGNEIHRCTTKR